MKCDSQYKNSFVMMILTLAAGCFFIFIGKEKADTVYLVGGVALCILTLVLVIENIGQRIRDDIVAELNPKP
jgi:hypothetical protein